MCLQLLDGLLSLAVVEWLHMYPSAQVLGFSTDHLDKDDKEAEGSGVVEATRFLSLLTILVQVVCAKTKHLSRRHNMGSHSTTARDKRPSNS